MNNLSCDIRKLLNRVEVLGNYDVEKLVIEHLQKNLNALDELQQSYQHHYLGIIQTLLQQLNQIPSVQQQVAHKRLIFLEKLLNQPSLSDLETLHKGISEMQRLLTPKPLPAADGQFIGDMPQPRSSEHTPIADKIQVIQRNNDRFAQTVRRLMMTIKQLGQDTDMAEAQEELEQQAQLLLQGQRQLARQLEQTKRQLAQAKAKNFLLDQELQHARTLSLSDELTGLPNRRAFLLRVEEEIGRVKRHPTPLSLAILDIDHFKKINDRYGHAIGDQVLCSYAKNILSSFRRHDHVARFGGEEFILLLPDTDIDGALKALGKIRDQVSQSHIQTDAGDMRLPTFSAGLTRYHPGETIDEFTERADKTLYQAKHKGRNRIDIAE